MPTFNRNRRSFRPGSTYRKSGLPPRQNSGSGRGRGKKGSSIHPSKFINRATERPETPTYESTRTFADFNLEKVIQDNLAKAGFERPSEIQDHTIELALEGKDVVGLANTGTGKTAAFLLPVLNSLYKTRKFYSVLVMAPTRELAQQIDVEFKKFADGTKLYAAVCVGGMPIFRQIQDLKRRPHVIIGTPGRIKDLIEREALRLDAVDVLVLDEVDRMLDMGFVQDIRRIVNLVPVERQTLCFSATMTPTVAKIIHEISPTHEIISVKKEETSGHIDQDIIEYRDAPERIEKLKDLLVKEEFEKVLIFGETKFGVQRLSDLLNNSQIPSVAIHGNKSQPQRTKALNAFRSSATKVMVATDVAARGLDIDGITHVINYDQPQSFEDYVHRIGRTGRGGKKGKALTFVHKPESSNRF